MEEEVDVLCVVVGLVCALDFLLWLSRVDALENAEAPELSQSQLKLPDGLCSCEVLSSIALDTLRAYDGED